MICSVCRLFDACQSFWKTQRYSTDDEQEIERCLTEVLQAMAWPLGFPLFSCASGDDHIRPPLLGNKKHGLVNI